MAARQTARKAVLSKVVYLINGNIPQQRAGRCLSDGPTMNAVLGTTLQGDVEKKIRALTTIIYAVGKERFGIQEKWKKKPYTPNCRELEIEWLRRTLSPHETDQESL